MRNRRVITDLTEKLAAYCDKCQTVRTLEYKTLKNGAVIVCCEKCGYCNPSWGLKG